MRASLLACAALLCACACMSLVHARITSRHIGALNHHLTREQMQATSDDMPSQWLTQTLDHQDLSSTETFQQQYLVNDTYFNPKTPRVFLMIGGEGPISPAYLSGHFIIGPLAAKYGALQVALEHRFYGQSVPGQDSNTTNLRFLSSAQALEDIVVFREHIMSVYNLTQAHWIVFGGSYSGSLSAWARAKYPHLFQGSYAASAPVRAELDFSQYFEVTANSLGPDVVASLRASTAAVTDLLASTSGRSKLQSMFNLCGPIVSDDDVVNFVETLTGPYAETVQYNDDAIARLEGFDIRTIQNLTATAGQPLEALLSVWNAFNLFNNNTECNDINYENYIKSMQQTNAGRSWTWQTCTEFGYYQTGESQDQPFSLLISLASFTQQCTDIFGIEGLMPRIQYINDFYGADKIVSTNTAWTNGDVDPWHALGSYQSYPAEAQSHSTLIHGTAHCADLYPPAPADLPGLTAARATGEQLLQQWLKDPLPKRRVHKPRVIRE